MTDQPISLVQADLAVDYAFVEKCEEEEDRVEVERCSLSGDLVWTLAAGNFAFTRNFSF